MVGGGGYPLGMTLPANALVVSIGIMVHGGISAYGQVPVEAPIETLILADRQDEEVSAGTADLDALDRLRSRPKLDVIAGVWFPRLEGLVTLGSGGTPLDAGPDLSLDGATTIFNGELEFEKGRWKFLVGGYGIDAGGNGILQQDSVVQGTILAAGTAVNSEVDVWSITTEASWSLLTPFRRKATPWSTPVTDFDPDPVIDLALQAVLGCRVINLEQRYLFAGYGTVSSNQAWVSPYLGGGFEIDWSTRQSLDFMDRIVFDVTAGWGPALSGGDGTFTVRADATFYPVPNLGISLGYRLNDWVLSRDDSEFDGGLQGLFAGVGYSW